MKKYTVFGVELSSLQEMMFNKWIANKGIAPNTLSSDERTELVKDFLKSLK